MLQKKKTSINLIILEPQSMIYSDGVGRCQTQAENTNKIMKFVRFVLFLFFTVSLLLFIPD